jgi:hypothetical protein
MKNKIIIEGQEFDLPQSLVDEIKDRLKPPKFEEVKKLTYEDVAKRLFIPGVECFWATERGTIRSHSYAMDITDPNASTSKKQVEKLQAINQLMNVAKYLNGDWKCKIGYSCFVIVISADPNESYKIICVDYPGTEVLFKSRELAQTAIEILGEDVIKLALSTDY